MYTVVPRIHTNNVNDEHVIVLIISHMHVQFTMSVYVQRGSSGKSSKTLAHQVLEVVGFKGRDTLALPERFGE